MKAWLSRAGVPFVVRDVEADDQAYDMLMALGFRAVPVTLAGAHAVRGYDPDALTAAIAAWRTQAGAPPRPSE